jgi:hypothetical protein
MTSFTGRPTSRAVSAVKAVCIQNTPFTPNPPPRKRLMTRTFSGSRPSRSQRFNCVIETPCVVS